MLSSFANFKSLSNGWRGYSLNVVHKLYYLIGTVAFYVGKLIQITLYITVFLNFSSTENILENLWNHFLTLSPEAVVTQYLSERSLRLKPMI
jgi:hypothetical protein